MHTSFFMVSLPSVRNVVLLCCALSQLSVCFLIYFTKVQLHWGGYLAYIIRHRFRHFFFFHGISKTGFVQWLPVWNLLPLCVWPHGSEHCVWPVVSMLVLNNMDKALFVAVGHFCLRSSPIRWFDLITWHRERLQCAAHYLDLNKTNNPEKRFLVWFN